MEELPRYYVTPAPISGLVTGGAVDRNVTKGDGVVAAGN
jgi:hypothetical protein